MAPSTKPLNPTWRIMGLSKSVNNEADWGYMAYKGLLTYLLRPQDPPSRP